jgi:hypothetical protein
MTAAGSFGVAVLALATAGCSAPAPAPIPTTPTGRASTSLPCHLESRPPSGTFTRYAARPGTRWWATYTVIANPCPTPAKLDDLTLLERQPGSGVTWSGTSQVRPLRQGQIPDAILPADSKDGPAVAGYTLAPGAQVMIVALVTAGGAKDVANRVPVLRLGLSDAGGRDELRLAPDLRLCACNPLAGQPNPARKTR